MLGHFSQIISSICPFPDSVRQRFVMETLQEHIFKFLVNCFAIFFELRSQRFHLAHQQKFVVRIRITSLHGEMRPESAELECRERRRGIYRNNCKVPNKCDHGAKKGLRAALCD